MKERIIIKLNDDDPIVIEQFGDESYAIIFNIPSTDHHEISPSLTVNGFRSRGNEKYDLEWLNKNVDINSNIQIQYKISSEEPTKINKETFYDLPEEKCSFCGSPKSEVRYLIKKSFLNCICDECIDACKEKIEELKNEKS